MKATKVMTAVFCLCISFSNVSCPFASAAEIQTVPKLFAATDLAAQLSANNNLNYAYSQVEDLPASCDLRAEGLTPAVRDQGRFGTCWAHGLTACMEMSQTAREPLVDYSEWYTAYYTFRGPVGTNMKEPEDEYDVFSYGGAELVALPVYANWIGPAREADYPYDSEIPSRDRNIADMQAESAVHVTEYNCFSLYPGTMTEQAAAVIKKAISEGHAVSFSMCSRYLYTSAMSSNYAYYTPEDPETVLADELWDDDFSGHVMALVGYDDNYPIENFTYKPKHKGAWLVRNSWGVRTHNDGYFWMSYDEDSMDDFAYVETEPAASREFIFSHDSFGGNGGFALNNNGEATAYAANVFTPQADTAVTDVMVDIFEAGDACEITLYTDLQNPDDPASGTPSAVTAFQSRHTGYQTVPLDTPVTAEAGKPFSVVVKYSGSVGYHIPCEFAYQYNPNYGKIKVPDVSRGMSDEMILRDFHPQESFVSADGAKWQDVYGMGAAIDSYSKAMTGNVCIKAIGVSAGAVLFSDYHDTLPAGTQLSLSATDGGQIYYSVNGGEFAPYTQPIAYQGGDLTVSAYTQEGNVTSRSYRQQQAGLTSLLLKSASSSKYADLASGKEIPFYLSSYDELQGAQILPIGRGTIRVNGETVPSGSSFPVDAYTKNYTIEIEAENMLPQTYQLKVISTDTMPIPEGVWVGTWFGRTQPEKIEENNPTYIGFDCVDTPIAVEVSGGKALVRNLQTGNAEWVTVRQDGKGGCELVFRGKTTEYTTYLTLPYDPENGFIGSYLSVQGVDWQANRPGDSWDSAFLTYVSDETLRTFPVYTDAEIQNAMMNYYAKAKGKMPTDAKFSSNADSEYTNISLYDGKTELNSYSVHRCGYFYLENTKIDISAYLTERQPLVIPEQVTVTGSYDDDGEVTANDAQQVLVAYVKGLADDGNTGMTDAQQKACDIDGDGKITAADAQYILLYYTENTVSQKSVTWEDLLKKGKASA